MVLCTAFYVHQVPMNKGNQGKINKKPERMPFSDMATPARSNEAQGMSESNKCKNMFFSGSFFQNLFIFFLFLNNAIIFC